MPRQLSLSLSSERRPRDVRIDGKHLVWRSADDEEPAIPTRHRRSAAPQPDDVHDEGVTATPTPVRSEAEYRAALAVATEYLAAQKRKRDDADKLRRKQEAARHLEFVKDQDPFRIAERFNDLVVEAASLNSGQAIVEWTKRYGSLVPCAMCMTVEGSAHEGPHQALVESFHRRASEIRSTMRIASCVRMEDRAALPRLLESEGQPFDVDDPFERLAIDARKLVTSRMNKWLSEAESRVRITQYAAVEGFGLELVSSGHGAFAVLTLIDAILLHGMAVCSNEPCSKSYEPSRRVRPGERNYCPACQHAGVAARQRRQFARKQLLASLIARGDTDDVIVAEMVACGAKQTSVARSLEKLRRTEAGGG